MQTGSICQCVVDNSELEKAWGWKYPKLNEVLTVSAITEHPNLKVQKAGIVLLYFEEYPFLIGQCDKNIEGIPNYVELRLPDDIEEILSAPVPEEIVKM